MATETLRLEITANNKAAVAALKETTSQLDAVGSHATATTNKLGTLSKGSNQAANALSNLGRVAQDAPFGFIGIQNNLNPLLESFQRLKVETGSTGGALKALGGSLMGAGGLGFALSAASALFLVFGDSIFGAGKKADEAAKLFTEATDSVVKDAAQVRLLANAYNNANTSQAERVQIIKELQKLAPEQFAMLNAEKTTYEQLTQAVNAYNGSIGNRIRAQIRTKDLENLIKEEQQLRKLVNLQEDFNMKMKTGRTTTAAGEKLNKNLAEQLKLEKEINSYQKAVTLPPASIKETKQEYGPATRTYQYEPPKSKYKEQRTQSSATGMPGAPEQMTGDNTAVQSAMELGRALEAQKGALAAYNEYMTEAGQLTNFAAQAFTDLGNAMLQGQTLGDALGNVFKKLAADIAAAAIKALIFQTILSAISGGSSTAVAGAAGKSTGGFGKLFKGFLGLGKGFAEGGIASGPKSGHLQLLHGTEAIFPMDKLAAYTDRAISAGMNMGSMGGPQQIQVSGRLVGNDIWLSQKRTDYQRGLTT